MYKKTEEETTIMESLSSPDFLTDLAVRYLKDGLLIEAIAILELTKTLHPEHAPVYCYLGQIMVEKYKNFQDAEAYLKKAIELDSSFPLTYQYLGQLLILMNRGSELKVLLKQMEPLPKKYSIPVLLDYGFTIEEKGKYNEAISIYKTALRTTQGTEEMDAVSLAIDRCLNKRELEELDEY